MCFLHSIKQGGMNLRVAVVCSDSRMVQVYDNLSKDFNVMKIDKDTDFLTLPMLDAIVFPVRGIDSYGYLNMEDKACHIPSQFWEIQKNDICIFCGMKNDYFERLSIRKYYYMEDQEVKHENAILTAEGVLNELIGCSDSSIYDVKVDVIGYGNCGKVIYEMLRNLHVDVRVVRRTCCRQKANFIELKDWKQCGDIIINTSIQKVMDKERMQKWGNQPIIIDIATPDVIDKKAAQELGIRVLRAGNLPGRFACITAGNIIACYIRGILKNER